MENEKKTKKKHNEIIFYSNHRLKIFDFVSFENSEEHIENKLYTYLKDLSFYMTYWQ